MPSAPERSTARSSGPSAESVRFARAEEEIADALDFMPLMAPCHLLTPGHLKHKPQTSPAEPDTRHPMRVNGIRVNG